MHTEISHLREVIIFLTAAALVVPLMHRLRISPVLGFLVVGMLIGPSGMGHLTDAWPVLNWIVIERPEDVRNLAEFGVVFLLFMIGLDLSFSRLWQMRRLVFGFGAAQVLVSAFIIGTAAYGFGNSAATSIILGSCLALSSTAIVMELLIKERRLGSRTGQMSFGILLFQDLAVVPVLFMVSVLGADAGEQTGFALLTALGKAFVAIALILALGRIVIRPIFKFVGATGSRELFMAAVLLIIISTAIATGKAGLSPALGAFIAGLLLSESEYRHQIEVDVEPFKGLLLGLFFVFVGMSIDVSAIAGNPFWIVLSVIGLFIIKSTVVFALALAFGHPRSVAAESALLLGQAGEFAFVVIALAVSLSLLGQDVKQFMLIVTSLTMLITPLVALAARRIGSHLSRIDIKQTAEQVPDLREGLSQHVIVAGYGRVGQMLGSLLGEQRIPHVGLDLDARLVSDYRSRGAAVYFGDASNPDILRHAGIDQATAFAVTMDSPKAAERVVRTVRKTWPDLPILARAKNLPHAKALREAGATDVVPEALEASLELAESVFQAAGFTGDAARQVVHERRKAEKDGMAQSGDPET